jgi:hypothetical protein
MSTVTDKTTEAPTVGAILRQCSLRVLLVPLGVAAIVGLILAAPAIAAAAEFVWYGWAKILTLNYTSVVPATLMEWVATVLCIWSVCVSCKLWKIHEDLSIVFGLLALAIFLLGIETTNCALYAVVSDWTLDAVTGWKLAGVLTNGINLFLTAIAGLIAGISFVSLVSLS